MLTFVEHESYIAPMKFADLVKKYRKEKKLTQAMLGQKVGVTQVAVGNYERGRLPKNVVLGNFHRLDPEWFPLEKLLNPAEQEGDQVK